MANTGFICQDSFLKKTEKLSDEQLGRLFRALMIYHSTGEIIPLDFAESIAFDFIREDIDKADAAYKAKCEQNRRNRASTPVNDRQRPSTTVNKEEAVSAPIKKGFMDETEAEEIQGEHDRIFNAAQDAGFKLTNDVMASLTALYTEYGLEKLLNGFKECSEHSASTLAYLRAVLKGKPKQAKPKVNAQDFEQRDYSGVQDDIMANLAAEMRQYKEENAG